MVLGQGQVGRGRPAGASSSGRPSHLSTTRNVRRLVAADTRVRAAQLAMHSGVRTAAHESQGRVSGTRVVGEESTPSPVSVGYLPVGWGGGRENEPAQRAPLPERDSLSLRVLLVRTAGEPQRPS